MADETITEEQLREAHAQRKLIEQEVNTRFAPEDTILHNVHERARAAGMPEIAISPVQGKLLQILAYACNAQKILEIGTLAGYSGIWLARALPEGGQLITLEANPKHAEVAHANFEAAGLSEKVELREGKAIDALPLLGIESPFDLIFIDADKVSYPAYLDWAIVYSRPGTIIVADNVIRHGRAFLTPPPDADAAALATYNEKILHDPRLASVAFPMDDDATDGFSISVVRG